VALVATAVLLGPVGQEAAFAGKTGHSASFDKKLAKARAQKPRPQIIQNIVHARHVLPENPAEYVQPRDYQALSDAMHLGNPEAMKRYQREYEPHVRWIGLDWGSETSENSFTSLITLENYYREWDRLGHEPGYVGVNPMGFRGDVNAEKLRYPDRLPRFYGVRPEPGSAPAQFRDVTSWRTFRKEIAEYGPGSRFFLTGWRNGERVFYLVNTKDGVDFVDQLKGEPARLDDLVGVTYLPVRVTAPPAYSDSKAQ